MLPEISSGRILKFSSALSICVSNYIFQKRRTAENSEVAGSFNGMVKVSSPVNLNDIPVAWAHRSQGKEGVRWKKRIYVFSSILQT